MADPTPAEPVRRSSRGGFFFLLFTCAAIYVGYKLRASYNVFDVQPFKFKPRPPLTGPLAPNTRLQAMERLLENGIQGPESIEVVDGKLYAGTGEGKVVEITDGKLTDEYLLVPGCSSIRECGRPLGIRHLKDKEFVVADPYRGLLLVNMNNKSHRVVLAAETLIEGAPMRFADDLDVLDEDTVLLSDCSTRWELMHFFVEMLEMKPTGRVLKVDLRTGEVTVLARDLYFANGMQLFPDKQSIVVGESTAARLIRLYLSGPKAGQKEVFLDNMPGFPDNVRLSSDGKSFWVACYAARVLDKFSFSDTVMEYPLVRRLILSLIPGDLLTHIFTAWKQKHAIAIQLSMKGEIIASLHDPSAKVLVDVTQVSPHFHQRINSFRSTRTANSSTWEAITLPMLVDYENKRAKQGWGTRLVALNPIKEGAARSVAFLAMADRVRSPKEARRSTLSWSKVLLLVVTGFAVYVGVKLKRSYEIYDVRVVP
uniref:Str_synth domain-containing protein n=1 Tax=Steinernema glaseri TaxID=37863 RepID=A0A1I7YKT6_9BILA